MTEHPSFEGLPPGEPVAGKTYRADGWSYMDTPKFTPDMWKLLLGVIGDGEYVVLAMSECRSPNDPSAGWVRGQLLVSPQGQKNSEAYANQYLAKN